MILFWIIVILLAGGVLAWAAAVVSPTLSRWTALLVLLSDFVITLVLWIRNAGASSDTWFEQMDWAWVPDFGIHFHLAVDGLSLLLLMLTFVLGVVSVLASWTEITRSVGFFHLNLLWILAGVAGVFLAVDLFLFYFAWELMLVPMYFLIAIWGHENRLYAAVKFFIFTQLSGLLMLIAILALYFVHHSITGVYTFQYMDLVGTTLSARAETWMMLGFFAAFAVKLPVVPLHTWLPDAHTEAPTAGSVILAGLLLKTGAYGMLRFVVPLFPNAAQAFAPIAMTLGVIGILYGAILSLGQTDVKRLVAYTSVSHLGFVLIAVFVSNRLALQGALMTMICHGISTGALFILAGLLQERVHTRELNRMGGLWTTVPRLGGVALFFALASLGLPGLGDFVGEFLILIGTYQRSIAVAILATVGVLATTFYALRFIQRVFHGANSNSWQIPDLVPREGIVMSLMIVVLLWLGLYPQPVLKMFEPAVTRLEQAAFRR
jgi:NADH-quinone oxidoreductase subunit M